MSSLKKLIKKLKTILWCNKHVYVQWFCKKMVFFHDFQSITLSVFGWYSFHLAESNSVLDCASDKVQWSCLLWSADFIDPLYTNSSHCAELACRGGSSDQKIKKGTLVRIEKLSFWESPVKIRDVAGIPKKRLLKMIHITLISIQQLFSNRKSRKLTDPKCLDKL